MTEITLQLEALWPVIPAFAALILWIWAQGRKVGRNEDTLADLKAAVCGSKARPELGLVTLVAVLTARVDKLCTQLSPFITLLDDSVSRMILGGKTNPLDMVMMRKIKLGLASVADVDSLDASIAKELEAQGPEAMALSNVRIWLALKKAEVLEQAKA